MTDAAPLAADLDAQVRAVDEDRWLASRFALKAARTRLIALYAVNHEIAKTAESVTDPHMAAIRLAWWREVIGEVESGKPRAHPAAIALAAAHQETPLPLDVFRVMLDARERDVDAAPFASWSEQTAYLDATAGGVIRLALAACGGRATDAFVRDAGRAWGLSGLLRARSFWESRNRRIFPAEARDAEAAARLMSNTAKAAHAQAKAAAKSLSPDLLPAYLYLTLVPRYLRDDKPPSLLSRQFKILSASLTGAL